MTKLQPDNEDAQAILAMHEHNLEGLYALQAEAVTVHHETGLGPRQLAQQRAELITAIAAVMDYAENECMSLQKHADDEESEQRGEQAFAACESARAILAQCKEGK